MSSKNDKDKIIEQIRNLEKHHNRVDDHGESLVKGSIPWLLSEALTNIEKIEELIGPKYNRPSKKDIKVVLRDLRDQLVELRGRLD